MHIPVLRKEVIKWLDPKANKNFIDGTISHGGHALEILEKTKPNGKLLGIDWDKNIISSLSIKTKNLGLEKRLTLVHGNFAELKAIIKKKEFDPINGILLDIGMSSWHIEESKRGFSFRENEMLDMRYSVREQKLNAKKIVNQWSEKEITNILEQYGEEKFAKKISAAIVEKRSKKPIKTTFDLVDIIKQATPSWYHFKKIHPATKTFQAIRIAVNQELENLKSVLPQSLEILANNGRMVIISFHSLEDRIVKRFFKQCEKEKKGEILTPKPIRASKQEIQSNPRSRSAMLRAFQKQEP